ncbi:MAG: hypothetical protein HXY30_02470 [Pseudorhodoplanes sp.]|nr:hypothetical protein [Pseudorhodoplanes sp.]
MKKVLLALAAVMMAVSLSGGVAEAAKKKAKVVVTPAPAVWYQPWTWPRAWPTWPFPAFQTQRDGKLETANAVVGGASLGAYYWIRHDSPIKNNPASAAFALSTIGCAAVSPIIGTMAVDRPLTMREVYISTGNCVVPFVGGWLMNAWFDRNGWE